MRGLVTLNSKRSEVVPREELVFECWGDRIIGEDSVHQMLSKLRRLSDQFGGVFTVETIRGLGYRLDAPPEQKRRSGRPGWAYPVAALLIAALLIGGFLAVTRPGSDRAIPSLVVLPFRTIGYERGGAYFAEAVGDEVQTILSRQRDMRTIGGLSATQLGPGADFRRVRAVTGATHMLKGSLQQSGDRVRINVRLLDTSDGTQLWANTFERKVSDIFAVQEDLASAVVAQLVDVIGERVSGRRDATSLQVYDLYLRAHSTARARTYPAIQEAIRLAEHAVALDPNYAPAHARLAIYRQIRDQQRPSGAYQDSAMELRKTRTHAERAISINPELAEAHAAMGMLNWMSDPPRALRHHRRALDLDPGNYLAWNNGGNALVRLCRPREATRWYARAAEIEPLLLTPYSNWSAALAGSGRRDEAQAVAKHYYGRTGDLRGFHRMGARLALARGDPSAAALHARAALSRGATDPAAQLALARGLRALGLREEAQRALPARARGTLGAYWRGDYAKAATGPLFLRGTDDELEEDAAARSLLKIQGHGRLLEGIGAAGTLMRQEPCNAHRRLLPFIAAAKANGAGQAASLLRAAHADLQAADEAGIADPDRNIVRAELLMLAGSADAALEALSAAAAQGWTGGLNSLASLSDPTFAALAGRPQFALVRRQVERQRAGERAQYLRQLALPAQAVFYE